MRDGRVDVEEAGECLAREVFNQRISVATTAVLNAMVNQIAELPLHIYQPDDSQ